MAMDIDHVRTQFPSLDQDRIFFDNPGGSQIVRGALERMQGYLLQINANRGGAFPSSVATDELISETRLVLKRFLNATRSEEIVFGPNMTSLTLSISRSLATQLSADDEIIVTRLDHDANIAPWLHAAEAVGCKVHWVDFDVEDCRLDVEGYLGLLNERTRLVALGYASNAVGTINPIARMVEAAHAVGALTYVDAVQLAPHRPIDVQALDCDFLVFSGYKVFGPHLGVLYGKHDLLQQMPAFKVRPASNDPPGKFETGTQNHEGIAAMLGALEYIGDLGDRYGASLRDELSGLYEPGQLELKLGMAVIEAYERGLALECIRVLSSLPGVQLYGDYEPALVDLRVPTFAIRVDPIPPRRIAQELANRGIYVWDGNFYALAVTERLGLEPKGGLVRIGPVHYNTMGEVQRLGNELESIITRLRTEH